MKLRQRLEHRHQRHHKERQPDPYADLWRDDCKDHPRDCQGNNNAQPFQKRFHFNGPFESRGVERENPAFKEVPRRLPRFVRDKWIHHSPLGRVAATLASDPVNKQLFAAKRHLLAKRQEKFELGIGEKGIIVIPGIGRRLTGIVAVIEHAFRISTIEGLRLTNDALRVDEPRFASETNNRPTRVYEVSLRRGGQDSTECSG